jgi:glycosyltransferase involved in cell wall biosynthesis
MARGSPRLLVIESAGNLWGSERVLLDMLATLEGMPVAVCCPPRTPILAELARLQLPVIPTFVERLHEKSRFARITALVGLLRACAVWRPSLLYLNQAGCYRLARVAARCFRIPLVVHVRIFDDVEYLARLAPRPDELRAIVAISAAVAEELAASPALRGLKVCTIYDAYAATATIDSPIVEQVVGSAPKVACVGRMVPIKGQDVLLNALAWLRGQGRDVRCRMVGSGEEHWQKLQAQSATLGLQDRVEWLGFLHEPVEALRDCPVMVVPSHREPLGRVIFEAWDAGCLPVAFAGSGGAAEVIEAANGGVLYPRQTAEDLGRAITAALDMRSEDRRAAIQRGRRWMSEHCAPARHSAELRQVFLGAAGLPAN